MIPITPACAKRSYNRRVTDFAVKKVAEANFPTRWGHVRIFGFEAQPATPPCAAAGENGNGRDGGKYDLRRTLARWPS